MLLVWAGARSLKFLSTIYIPTINHNAFLSHVADTDVIFIALTRNLWLGCGWIIPWIFIARLWRRFLYLLSWIRVFVEKPSVTSPCHPFQWRAVNSNFDECIITSSVTPQTFKSLRGNLLIINKLKKINCNNKKMQYFRPIGVWHCLAF